MHIVINGWFLNQPNTGSGQYLRQLITRLPRLAPQHEFILVVPDRRSFRVFDLHTDANLQSLISNLQPPTSDFRKLLFEQSIIPRAARALRADLIHVPYWAPPLRASVPIVVTIHDVIPLVLKEYRGGPLGRLYTGLVTAAARGAALTLTDSEASKRDILQHLGVSESRVRTIYLAADPKFTPRRDPVDHAAVRRKYDLPDNYVLYLSGFDPRKNVEAALQVYTWGQDAIGHSHPLVVAGRLPEGGDGFFTDPREIVKRIEIEDVVQFIGEVDEEDKVALYQGASAFLYPSRREGFGLPALEALACGVPVIGSEASSIPEIVGDAGMLVSPDDARAMAGALIAVVTEPPLREALSERALKQAARFSWDKTARETVEAYESVMKA
ncbi:MAG TPA: glycosyltransferase family 1 protein [Anaerolineae bacterium]|nr:glycosyltransferase family 1 protein [Anaerolineae bacterium]